MWYGLLGLCRYEHKAVLMVFYYSYDLSDTESFSMHNAIHSWNAVPLILFILFVQVL